MNRQMVHAVLLVSALVAAAVPAAAGDKFPEPTGFGKAKFGMSAAQVTKLIPKVHPSKAMAAAAGQGEQVLTIYELEDQRVGPLKKCKAEFRFYKDELYEIQFRCPERVKVGQYLEKTFGMPTKFSQDAAFWIGQQAAVSLSPRSGAFAYSDVQRSQALQTVLFAYMHKSQGNTGAAGAETTPAAPEAPAAAPTVTPPAAGAPETPAHE